MFALKAATRAVSSSSSSSFASLASASRFASTLVYVDHNGSAIHSAVKNTVAAAKSVGGDITAFVAGGNEEVVAQVAALDGVSKVLFAPGNFEGQLAESVTPALQAVQDKFNFSHIFAPSTTSGKNILPRLAAKLDVSMLSDIVSVDGEDQFKRLVYAGNILASVTSSDAVKVATVRNTSFDAVADGNAAPSEEFAVDASQSLSTFVSQEIAKSDRPELGDAARVVSGGRSLKSEENFQMIYDLADKLGAAVGATRAAVDAGYCPNDLQVGQTGKVVAPDLYVAVGISGAIQHLAGMKDSKVIVCINKDPEAPIFQVSDYGLEADLFKAVPELMEKL
eukprot:m.20058 g.20058  ORF g.20058 m.20058 type:complete len:337 (+) comp8540_c0_seq1:57-1067(+)